MRIRPKIRVRCANCNKWHWKYKYNVKQSSKVGYKLYCSKSCSNKGLVTGALLKCACCGKDVWKYKTQQDSKSGDYFCSHSCAAKINNTRCRLEKNHPGYTNGRSSYRSRAIKKYGPICKICGYSNARVVVVHHIDKNRNNNKLKNLVVLCPTHHWEVHLGIAMLK